MMSVTKGSIQMEHVDINQSLLSLFEQTFLNK